MMYEENYGATFYDDTDANTGKKHTYVDFGLFPAGKPVITPPEAKTHYVDIPGADGTLDFTDKLTGEVYYEDREISLPYKIPGDREKWDSVWHSVLNFLHGKRKRLAIDEDCGGRIMQVYDDVHDRWVQTDCIEGKRGGYYVGRFSVNEPEYHDNSAYLTITGTVYPYRIDFLSTTDDWIWDSFNFYTGVIRNYKDITVSNSRTVTIVGSRMPVTPVFVASVINDPRVVYYTNAEGETNGITMTSTGVEYSAPDFLVREGEASITIHGDGVLSVIFRAGTL